MIIIVAALLTVGVLVFIVSVRARDLPEPEPVSPFDHLDFDFPENGLGQPLVCGPCTSSHLLTVVHKRHPPRMPSFHKSHQFTPFQWDSVLWFPRGGEYRPHVTPLQ